MTRKYGKTGSHCRFCRKSFKSSQARDQHVRDVHKGPPKMSTQGARAVMDGMDDLPDGAFFALAGELGLSPEDFEE